MHNAFVFGKFLPFHKGHEAMIRFALNHCDQLTVLVCAAQHEGIAGKLRQQWTEHTFAAEGRLSVQLFQYSETDLPCTSVSSEEVSELWARVFKQQLPHCTTVVTSEPYGDYVARFMGIQHIMYDPDRMVVPISATAIRAQPSAHLNYLPYAVKEYYTKKVVLLGTESTGKSTLAQRLAHHFNCALVTEAGRDLIADSNDFTVDDLYKVAEEHARRIKQAVMDNSPLIVIDTDVHITQSYARYVFGQELLLDPTIYAANKANLYLYLNKDVAFVQDGTRFDEDHRNALDASHRTVLTEHQVPLYELEGSWDERFRHAVVLVYQLLQSE